MKEKIKLVIVFIIGITISVIINVSAATVIAGSEVSYTSNSNTTVNGALSNLDSKITSMGNRVTTLEGKSTVKYARQGWGTSLTFTLPQGYQVIVLQSKDAVYQIWNSGGGFNSRLIYGTAGCTFSLSGTQTINTSCTGNSTITAFIAY